METAEHWEARYRRYTHVLPGMTEKQARRARMLDVPTVVVVLLVTPALVLHFSDADGLLGVLSDVLNWLIYGWFAFEFFYMLYLAPDNREYVVHHKLELFVLLATVPVLPNMLQALWVLRLLRLLEVVPNFIGHFVSVAVLPYAVVLAFIGVFGGGAAFAHFEDTSLFDGMYWANTTINTVGYGDVSAQTNEGKLLSMVVQWTGNVILALFIGGVAAATQRMLLGTANIEQKLDKIEDVEKVAEEVEEDIDSLLVKAQDLSVTDRVILKELQDIKRQLKDMREQD